MNNIPAEISEFLVNSLQRHCDWICVVVWVVGEGNAWVEGEKRAGETAGFEKGWVSQPFRERRR